MLLSFDRPAIAGLSLLAAAIATCPGAPAAGQAPWREDVTVTAAVEPLGLPSKYVLDVARHRATAAVGASLSDTIAIGARVGHTARVDGRADMLVDARVSRRVGTFRVAVDLRNLLDEDYQEIVGVEMPGRNGRVELAWTAR